MKVHMIKKLKEPHNMKVMKISKNLKSFTWADCNILVYNEEQEKDFQNRHINLQTKTN